jgi:hypothetical protein
MTSSTATPSDSSFLIALGAGSGYNTGFGATGFVAFLTGTGLPYLELLGPPAEWLGWIVRSMSKAKAISFHSIGQVFCFRTRWISEGDVSHSCRGFSAGYTDDKKEFGRYGSYEMLS